MSSDSNLQAQLFAATDQKLCACGCGRMFFVSGKGRKRIYLNDTHKKRAQRQRDRGDRSDGNLPRIPRGWLYLNCENTELMAELWATFTIPQREVLEVLCSSHLHYAEFVETTASLFGMRYNGRKYYPG